MNRVDLLFNGDEKPVINMDKVTFPDRTSGRHYLDVGDMVVSRNGYVATIYNIDAEFIPIVALEIDDNDMNNPELEELIGEGRLLPGDIVFLRCAAYDLAKVTRDILVESFL